MAYIQVGLERPRGAGGGRGPRPPPAPAGARADPPRRKLEPSRVGVAGSAPGGGGVHLQPVAAGRAPPSPPGGRTHCGAAAAAGKGSRGEGLGGGGAARKAGSGASDLSKSARACKREGSGRAKVPSDGARQSVPDIAFDGALGKGFAFQAGLPAVGREPFAAALGEGLGSRRRLASFPPCVRLSPRERERERMRVVSCRVDAGTRPIGLSPFPGGGSPNSHSRLGHPTAPESRAAFWDVFPGCSRRPPLASQLFPRGSLEALYFSGENWGCPFLGWGWWWRDQLPARYWACLTLPLVGLSWPLPCA